MGTLLANWLSGNALRLLGWSALAATIAAVLLGAKQAGRSAERYDQLKKIVEIKDAQLRATLDAPHARPDLANRLRRGQF